MTPGTTKISKKFAWLPVKLRDKRTGGYFAIWLRFYYEKRVYVESPIVTGWLVYRSTIPFNQRSHLKVIK